MISLILMLAIVGCVVYFITTYIPMAPPFKTLIYVVAAICIVLYLMQVFGVADLPLPRAR